VSQTDAGILIVSLSARALAASARSAGMAPRVVDRFGDADTRRTCAGSQTADGLAPGFDDISLYEAACRLDPKELLGLVYGSGFEGATAQLRALTRRRTLLGNPPEVLETLGDPCRVDALLARLGIPHPQIRGDWPGAKGEWLAKRPGGCGGHQVQWSDARTGSTRGSYFQRYVCGRSLSATLLADARNAQVLGYCEQWCAEGIEGHPFTYGGAVTLDPGTLPKSLTRSVEDAANAVAGELGLRGLCSLDFILDGERWSLIEINPRPGATAELHEHSENLFSQHVEAVHGRLGRQRPSDRRGSRAHSVIYAPRRARVPARWTWPSWVSDLPDPDTLFERAAPVCTVHAGAADRTSARRRTRARHQQILHWMKAWPTS
jgi:predicted ATP-grasp superfamily ATP-dependent carboligase